MIISVSVRSITATSFGSTLLRRPIQHVWRHCLSSSSSGKCDLVETHIDELSKVATLTMANPPVNSLSLEM